MGSLMQLCLSLAPEISDWLLKANVQTAVESINAAVQETTGTTDPDAVSAMIARDPERARALQDRLTKLAAQVEKKKNGAATEHGVSGIRDLSDVNGQLENGSTLSGVHIISVIVLFTFALVMTLVMTREVPEGSETVLNIMLGTLSAMSTSVVGYWVGSSAGSARKDERLAQLQVRSIG